MKKIIVLFIGLLVFSCEKEVKNEYVIDGTLEGVADGTKVALTPYAKYDVKPEAETTIENGHFSFKGSVPEPRLYFVVLGDGEGYYRVMVENADINLSGKALKQPARNGGNAYYTFEDMQVSGSKSHDYLTSQMAAREELDSIYNAIETKYKDINQKISEARGTKDTVKLKELTQLPEYQAYSEANKAFFASIEEKYQVVFDRNSDTYWGPLMMLNLYSYFTPEQRPQFDAMSEEAKTSYYGKMVEAELYPANRTGEQVPDFTTTGLDGKSYTLNDLIKDKKIVLIDFWASWCAPCRKELPNVKSNYEKYAAQGFDVISISIDKNPKAWQKALEEEQMPWPNFNDNEVASLYKVSAVPTTYLIDNQGKLIADNVRGEDLGKTLAEFFEKN